MNKILELDDINDNNLNLIWVYIQKENGFYMGQAKKNENETEIEKKNNKRRKRSF